MAKKKITLKNNNGDFLLPRTDISAVEGMDSKQDKLTAGNNVSITNNIISATDTTYTAGSGITINNNVINAEIPTFEIYED